ncbi:BgTH12-05289 [Blumeria graminis f. sp. triticale]|uniref:BgtAc-30160 n=3 Tax=Blumeria graminis TaxID=34373 RepID=A0A9X9MHR7_BLUGR|nr:hypothetical protein BGT96224_Ac30160 [Blumeria graminis f. sp. tritici 96224]CAD6502699.1 BgTH12-05289 [Blumeria graminis f. sp. triticale]VDB88132.1 BgtAc-30160 [Blumeria graminis f. sp. tritici]
MTSTAISTMDSKGEKFLGLPHIEIHESFLSETFGNGQAYQEVQEWPYAFKNTVQELASVEISCPGSNTAHDTADRSGTSNREKEIYERHAASARYFTRQLLNSFCQEHSDAMSSRKLPCSTVKCDFQSDNPKHSRGLERKFSRWKNGKKISMKRVWAQLKELSTNLLEANEVRDSVYVETRLFGSQLEVLEPMLSKPSKNAVHY